MFDIIFCCTVMYVAYVPWTTFLRLLMFKWKQKEAVVFDIIFHLIADWYSAICRITGVVPNSDPLPDYYPPNIGRVRCGGGVRIRQSDSDFNERGNNLAGGRKWAQHRTCVVPSPAVHTPPCRTCEVWTTEDAVRNLRTLDRDGNADSNRSGG